MHLLAPDLLSAHFRAASLQHDRCNNFKRHHKVRGAEQHLSMAGNSAVTSRVQQNRLRSSSQPSVVVAPASPEMLAPSYSFQSDPEEVSVAIQYRQMTGTNPSKLPPLYVQWSATTSKACSGSFANAHVSIKRTWQSLCDH